MNDEQKARIAAAAAASAREGNARQVLDPNAIAAAAAKQAQNGGASPSGAQMTIDSPPIGSAVGSLRVTAISDGRVKVVRLTILGPTSLTFLDLPVGDENVGDLAIKVGRAIVEQGKRLKSGLQVVGKVDADLDEPEPDE